MFKVDRRVNESVVLMSEAGDVIVIHVSRVGDKAVTIGVHAPATYRIGRAEAAARRGLIHEANHACEGGAEAAAKGKRDHST